MLSHYRIEGKRGKCRGTNTEAYFRFWLDLKGKGELQTQCMLVQFPRLLHYQQRKTSNPVSVASQQVGSKL